MAPVVLVIFVFKIKEYVVWCARDAADDACVCLLMSSSPALKDIFVSELFNVGFITEPAAAKRCLISAI